MSEIVVPDAIEPIEGWKGLGVNPKRFLFSNYNGEDWVPSQPFEAICSCTRHSRKYWEPVDWHEVEPEIEEHPYANVPQVYATPSYAMSAASVPIVTLSGGVVGYTGPATVHEVPYDPPFELPSGKRWKLMHKMDPPHDPPQLHEGSCGIYIADNPGEASNYGIVLCKVKGWGRVVEHGKGWRVQYAYPSELYVPRGVEIADYGVPIYPAGIRSPKLMTAPKLVPVRKSVWRQIFPVLFGAAVANVIFFMATRLFL